jgi:hypothetical protein
VPDQVICLTPYDAGQASATTDTIPAVQVRTRGDRVSGTSLDLQDAVYEVLHGRRRTLLGTAPNQVQVVQVLRRNLGQLGPDGDFRWYDRDGSSEAFRGWGNVNWSNDGGSVTDLEKVTVVLDGKGPNTIITNPNAPAGVAPSITSVTPATCAAASTPGFLTVVKGDYFIGTVSMVIGATAITQFTVIDRYTIVASLPTKTAGTYDIRATNATGQSAIVAADSFIVT